MVESSELGGSFLLVSRLSLYGCRATLAGGRYNDIRAVLGVSKVVARWSSLRVTQLLAIGCLTYGDGSRSTAAAEARNNSSPLEVSEQLWCT